MPEPKKPQGEAGARERGIPPPQSPFGRAFPPRPAGSPQTISGILKDHITGKPLSGVRVVITNGKNITLPLLTTNIGSFSAHLPPGWYDVIFFDPKGTHKINSLRGVELRREGRSLGEITGIPLPQRAPPPPPGGGKKKEEEGTREKKEEEEEGEEEGKKTKEEKEKEEKPKRKGEVPPEKRRLPQARGYLNRISQSLRSTLRSITQSPRLKTFSSQAFRTTSSIGRSTLRFALQTARNAAASLARGIGGAIRAMALVGRLGTAIAGLAAATSEIWVPAAVIGGAVAFFLLAFFLIISHFNVNPKKPLQEKPITGRFTVIQTGDITQCLFYMKDVGVKIGNPDIASFIQTVASKIGVPATVLLGIFRIERGSAFTDASPTYFTNDYDATPSFTNCCFGSMQFMPTTFIGVLNAALKTNELPQKFPSDPPKAAVDATIQPQVIPPPSDAILRITSVRDSFIAAAFKVRNDKNGQFGGAAPWNEAAVRYIAQRYHGACPYVGGGSYCDDLARSFNECQPIAIVRIPGEPSTLPVPGPIPDYPPMNQIQAQIEANFGITLTGFDPTIAVDQHMLKWMWDKLFETMPNTRFTELIRGKVEIQSIGSTGLSQTKGVRANFCRVEIRDYNAPGYFKFILTHELGHAIKFCNPTEVNKENEYFQAWAQEVKTSGEVFEPKKDFPAAVSFYGRHAARCLPEFYSANPEHGSKNEGYADVIAYYLNPTSGHSACTFGGAPPNEHNPYFFGFTPLKPLHYNVAKLILQK